MTAGYWTVIEDFLSSLRDTTAHDVNVNEALPHAGCPSES